MTYRRRLNQADMHVALAEMDQAIQLHEQWLEDVHSTLVCHTEADPRDLDDEAWHNCRFGQWYYASVTGNIAELPGFREVEAEHRKMHECATRLLRAITQKQPTKLSDYKCFTNAMKRMRLEILTLKRQLEVALYNIDPLTGVPGRMQMLQKLREDREFATRSGHPCAVAMLDVDRFKTVNDTYGHLAGDHALKAVANHVQEHLRQYDSFFRFGGEEFLLCMPDADTQTARQICDRLRSELSDLVHRPEQDRDTCFRATVSFGVAELTAEDPVEEALRRADQALLAAKAAGRNRVEVWETGFADNQMVA